LENLAFWEKGQEYLYGNNQVQNNCKDKNISNCNKNNKCAVYKSKKCVSKDTIHHFVEGETIKNQIFGKNYEIKSIYIPDEVRHKIVINKMIEEYYLNFDREIRKSVSNKVKIMNFIPVNNRNIFIQLLTGIKNQPSNDLSDDKIIDTLKNLRKMDIENYRRIIKEYFRIIDERNFQNNNNNNNNIDYYIGKINSKKLFFYVFNEIDSRNVYIIFPSGEILSELYKSDFFLNRYFDYAVEYIKQLDADNVILGGHSMGCVYAQYIGNILLKQNKDLFESPEKPGFSNRLYKSFPPFLNIS
jgi:hypothetical protein